MCSPATHGHQPSFPYLLAFGRTCLLATSSLKVPNDELGYYMSLRLAGYETHNRSRQLVEIAVQFPNQRSVGVCHEKQRAPSMQRTNQLRESVLIIVAESVSRVVGEV